MGQNNNTTASLHSLFKLNGIRVSRRTISDIINNSPMLDSIRGISDMFDTLHVEHVVAKITYEQLCEINSPVLGVFSFDKESYCVIIESNTTEVIIKSSLKNKNITLPRSVFENYWSTMVIAIEETDDCKTENPWQYTINNAIYFIERHTVSLLSLSLLMMTVIWISAGYNLSNTYLTLILMKIAAIAVSAVIIYKTLFDDQFLNNLCKIGRKIDCNRVLKSRASKLFNWIGLGEAAMIYFVTTLLWLLLQPIQSMALLFVFALISLGFVAFSVVWQLAIVRKICMLCMLINLILITDFLIIAFKIESVHFSMYSFPLLLCLPIVMLVVNLVIQTYRDKQKLYLLERKNAQLLLNNNLFQCFVTNAPKLFLATKDECITNHYDPNKKTLSIITNPSCGVCKELHYELSKLTERYNIQLIFTIFPNDTKGEQVALNVLTIYQTKGWIAAHNSLEQWFDNKIIDQNLIVSEYAKSTLKNHTSYCVKNRIKSVPVIAIDNHIFEDGLYSLNELKYLL